MRAALGLLLLVAPAFAQKDEPVRVFVFAGQSNMVGADSKVADVDRFPPFAGLGEPQENVRFRYVIGRENKTRSDDWVALQPINGMVGPELSFAREVGEHVEAPLAIVKVATGGTHLGGDWNPDTPSGFELYPLLIETVREALGSLEGEGVPYRLEGFVWHQGENDMFNAEYQAAYGDNLRHFVASVRHDLDAPDLRFYIGELNTRTIWGMDLRPRMYAISQGQKEVAASDPRVDYVPTSQVAAEIGRPYGLHYHYGTLGQLEHGAAHARAYLRTLGIEQEARPPLAPWPIAAGETVRLFVLAGHRNMEGEVSFTADLERLPGGAALAKAAPSIPYRYSTGGSYTVSPDWEALGPAGAHGTFGPELSFAHTLNEELDGPIAIAKFTHGGSQIIDWTPEGSVAVTRNLYPAFLGFVRRAIADLEQRGHPVELAAIVYHYGENDTSWGPFRREGPARLAKVIEATRRDLEIPELRWIVSQQPPAEHEDLDGIDVTSAIAELASSDPRWTHVRAFDLPAQERQSHVLEAPAVVALGELQAKALLALDNATRDLLDFSARPPGAVPLVGDSEHRMVPEGDGENRWTFEDGVLTASPSWDSVVTPDAYGDFRMHLEFNVNEASHENREKNGNSGVYIQQRYEVQILDSFGVSMDEYQGFDCASLYRLKQPDANACRPAGEWQTYDIVFRAARFEGESKVEDARITVFQNDVLVHDDFALPRKTGAGKPEGPEPLPIKLQGHSNPVHFRNVWIEALELEAMPQVAADDARRPA